MIVIIVTKPYMGVKSFILCVSGFSLLLVYLLPLVELIFWKYKALFPDKVRFCKG